MRNHGNDRVGAQEVTNRAAKTPGDILLEPHDIEAGGSSVVPLAGRSVLGKEPSDKLCFIFSALLARPKRFELLTPRFVVWCRIHLSHERDASR